MDKELLNNAREAESVEALLLLAEENNIEMEKEEAERIFSHFHSEGEVSEDELESVSGGGCKTEFSGPKYLPGTIVESREWCIWCHDSSVYEIVSYDTETKRDYWTYDWITDIEYKVKCSICGGERTMKESSLSLWH